MLSAMYPVYVSVVLYLCLQSPHVLSQSQSVTQLNITVFNKAWLFSLVVALNRSYKTFAVTEMCIFAYNS